VGSARKRSKLIVSTDDGGVIGWARLFPWNQRGFDIVEDLVYVDPVHQGRGIGRALLRSSSVRPAASAYRTIVATIATDNRAGLELHSKLGFEVVGTIRDAAHKFDRWMDITLVQLALEGRPETDATPSDHGQWINYEDTGAPAGRSSSRTGCSWTARCSLRRSRGPRLECRFITWDARCHGETESTNEPFSYWDLADDLKGLLDHLGIERAVIGGMSQGGFVALRFALKYPENEFRG